MKGNAWTAEELRTLRELWPASSGKARAKLPNHTYQSIRSKASELGLTSKRKPWSAAEDADLRAGVLPDGRNFPAANGRSTKLEEKEGSPEKHPWGNWHGNAGFRRGEWTDEEKASLEARKVPPGRSWQQATMYLNWHKNTKR